MMARVNRWSAWTVIALCAWMQGSARAESAAVAQAQALRKAGQHEAAANRLRAAIRSNPKDVRAHYVLAWTYISLGNKQKAAEHFRQVVKLAGDSTEGKESAAALERLGIPAELTQAAPAESPPAAEPEEGEGAGEEAEAAGMEYGEEEVGESEGGEFDMGGFGEPDQGETPQAGGGAESRSGPGEIIVIAIALVCWGLVCFCCFRIFAAAGSELAWMAWIPLLNIVPMLQAADKPLWWFLLFLVPFVNIVITVLVWMAIVERLGKPGWLGVLMIVPSVNLLLLLYLGFTAQPAVSDFDVEPA